jgi:hypothetical protein
MGGNIRSRGALAGEAGKSAVIDRGSRSRRSEKRRGVVKDIPVEQSTNSTNYLKTAKRIGLTIPPNVLARADKVIR